MSNRKNIVIIGAGPCGLMAAEILAEAGLNVHIYDRMPSPARKLLIAGRGGLNITHSEPLDKFITRYGDAQNWLAPSINNFTPENLVKWCEGLGQETFIGSSGRIFPRSMKTVQLLRAWLKRLEKLGVKYFPRHTWNGWDGNALCFTNEKHKKVLITADEALLALGGASWPRLGSNGTWTSILSQKYIEINPLEPSNCGFIVNWSDYFKSRFAGNPLKPLAVTHNGITRQGEAMITAKGIEGGVIYALSSDLRNELNKSGKAIIHLDLRPDMPIEILEKKLQKPQGNKSFSSFMKSLGFSPLITALLYEVDKEINKNPEKLAQLIKELPLNISATTGIERAISSAGGIKQSELNEDFMLKKIPGIFAAGEMLDWEAPTGGYLLQACFSTAVSAAEGVLKYVGVEK